MSGIPEISVIIPTFNRAESLRETLSSLARQTMSPGQFEIIVVDDGSQDATEQRVASFAAEHPWLNLRYDRHAANRGKAAASNTGIRIAQCELIALLDDDIRPVPGWLEAHVQRHRIENQDVSVTGLVLYPAEWARKSNWVRFANDNYRKNETIKRLESGSLPPNRFAGGNTSVRRETLMRVGLFDETMRRGEDVELAWRMFEAKVPLYYQATAVVYHYAEAIQSIEVTLSTFRRYYETDRLVFQKKYPSSRHSFGHWFLEPIDRVHDDSRRKAVKLIVRFVTNDRLHRVALRLVRLVDPIPYLYRRPLYQYLMACEAVEAIKDSERGSLPGCTEALEPGHGTGL